MNQENYHQKTLKTLSIEADDFIKLGILGAIAFLFFAIYLVGHVAGRSDVMSNASRAVCVRSENPAPKEWCNDVILKEVYGIK